MRFLRIQKGGTKADPPFFCVSRLIQRDLGGGSSIYTPEHKIALYGPLKRKYGGVGGLVRVRKVSRGDLEPSRRATETRETRENDGTPTF